MQVAITHHTGLVDAGRVLYRDDFTVAHDVDICGTHTICGLFLALYDHHPTSSSSNSPAFCSACREHEAFFSTLQY